MSNRPAVELSGVARRFAQRWVLRGVDLTAQQGEAIAVMGKNGSGKTTLLRVIATLLRPTRGTGTILGFDLVRDAADVRETVGLLGHHSGLYDDLTAVENLRFSLRMAGLSASDATIEDVLHQVGLHPDKHERVRGFSAGMRRRLALGRLLLRTPKLLLLDEPYAAFDPAGIDLINGFARKIAADGGTVLIVTHDYARARSAVDRVVRIENGRIYEGLTGGNLSADDQALAVGDQR